MLTSKILYNSRCPRYQSLPAGCVMKKNPGECCAKPDCSGMTGTGTGTGGTGTGTGTGGTGTGTGGTGTGSGTGSSGTQTGIRCLFYCWCVLLLPFIISPLTIDQ